MENSKIRRLWKSYKYRFTPWLALNLSKRLVKVSDQHGEAIRTSQEVLEELVSLLRKYEEQDVKLLYRASAKQREHFKSVHNENQRHLFDHWGFQVSVQPSSISGNGVFVTRGRIRKGQITSLYPGTVYAPFQPIMLQSIRNQYLFRCADGRYVDGSNVGLSRVIYKSCHGRDRIGMRPMSDISWLTPTQAVNPLNVGQIVNNSDGSHSSNVAYMECDVPGDLDIRLKQFLPNVHFSVNEAGDYPSLRIIPLLATKDIDSSEELFSTYFSAVD